MWYIPGTKHKQHSLGTAYAVLATTILLLVSGCLSPSPHAGDGTGTAQSGIVNIDTLQTELSAIKKTVGSINYDTDVWVNRLMIVGVFCAVLLGMLLLYWRAERTAQHYAQKYGYEEGRRQRLASEQTGKQLEKCRGE